MALTAPDPTGLQTLFSIAIHSLCTPRQQGWLCAQAAWFLGGLRTQEATPEEARAQPSAFRKV